MLSTGFFNQILNLVIREDPSSFIQIGQKFQEFVLDEDGDKAAESVNNEHDVKVAVL